MIVKDTFFSKKRTLNFSGFLFEIKSPIVMGILNCTPDSFFDGGKYICEKDIVTQCAKMLSEGASIIDIGAYSSRPGANDVSEAEEWNRLANVLKLIRNEFPNAVLSVDTFRSEIARRVITDFGVQLINDISAGEMDNQMMDVVAKLKTTYIMMHMRGTPQTMQQQTQYNNLIVDMLKYFAMKVEMAKQAGILDIIIDPGFGFSKTIEQNFELLYKLKEFEMLELPLLVGISRKSMIFKTIETNPEQALSGTITANTIALLNGADILRVHDVREAVDSIKIVEEYKKSYLGK